MPVPGDVEHDVAVVGVRPVFHLDVVMLHAAELGDGLVDAARGEREAVAREGLPVALLRFEAVRSLVRFEPVHGALELLEPDAVGFLVFSVSGLELDRSLCYERGLGDGTTPPELDKIPPRSPLLLIFSDFYHSQLVISSENMKKKRKNEN